MSTPIMITDTEMTGALKNVYETIRVKAWGLQTPLLSMIKKGKAGGAKNLKWGGNGVIGDVVLDMPEGYTASQLGHLPDSSNETEKQFTIGIKRTYITRTIDGLTDHGTKSKEAAFISIQRKVFDGITGAAKRGQQETLHGDGTAVKALVTAVNSTTEIEVASPYGIANAGSGGLLIGRGARIAVLDTSAANAVLGRAKVTGVTISGATATLTLDTAISSMQTTDKVVSCTDSDTSYTNYPDGLRKILNMGGSYDSYNGIDAATDTRWNTTRLEAGVDTQSASTPDEMDVWELSARVSGRSGFNAKEKPGEVLRTTTPGIYKKVAMSFFGQRHMDAANMIDIKGGFKGLSLFGAPLIEDYWQPAGTLYQLRVADLAWVDQQDFSRVVDFGGGGLYRWVNGRDAFSVHYKQYWNFAGTNRITQGAIFGYTDSNHHTYSHAL